MTVTSNVSALNLVVVYVADLARSCEFYRQLGLPLVAEQHGRGPRHYSATLGETMVIELYPQGTREVSRTRLGFAVADVDAAIAQLRDRGLAVGEPAERDTGALVAVVTDPDGNNIELVGPANCDRSAARPSPLDATS